MSALGQKQTSAHVRVMSALPLKAAMDQQGRDVRFVPSRHCAASFDHLVGEREQHRRNIEVKRLCGLEINNEVDFGHLNDR